MMVEVSVTSAPSPGAPPSRKVAARTSKATADAPHVMGTYGRVAAWLAKRVEVALAQVELTLPQYRVLGILAEGKAAASGLADRLAVRRPEGRRGRGVGAPPAAQRRALAAAARGACGVGRAAFR